MIKTTSKLKYKNDEIRGNVHTFWETLMHTFFSLYYVFIFQTTYNSEVGTKLTTNPQTSLKMYALTKPGVKSNKKEHTQYLFKITNTFPSISVSHIHKFFKCNIICLSSEQRTMF